MKCKETDWIEQYRIQAVCNINIKRKINQQEYRIDYKRRRKEFIIDRKKMAIKKLRDTNRKKIHAILNDMGIDYVSRTHSIHNENCKKERSGACNIA